MNNPTEMRVEFEAWADKAGWNLQLHNHRGFERGGYKDTETNIAYEAWQAAHSQLMPLLVEARDALDDEASQHLARNGIPCGCSICQALNKLNLAIGEGK